MKRIILNFGTDERPNIFVINLEHIVSIEQTLNFAEITLSTGKTLKFDKKHFDAVLKGIDNETLNVKPNDKPLF